MIDRARQRNPNRMADHIPDLKQPTLILWGGRDRLIPPEAAERFHRDIAGSKLVIFDDLGHAPEEENPARSLRWSTRVCGLRFARDELFGV